MQAGDVGRHNDWARGITPAQVQLLKRMQARNTFREAHCKGFRGRLWGKKGNPKKDEKLWGHQAQNSMEK